MSEASTPPDKVLPAQRRRDITRFVSDHGHATIGDLAERFMVSTDTIRRDLDQLATHGSLLRTYGGVVKPEGAASIHHVNFDARVQANLAAKRAIATAAARLVASGSTVLVNGGTTVLEFGKALGAHRRLTVVTNNLQLPTAIPEPAVAEIHILAGHYDPTSLVTLGPVQLPNQYGTEAHSLFADYAVLGVGGVAVGAGFTGTDVRESSMIRSMMDQAAAVIVLADSSKFARQALVAISAFERADYLVTDATPDAALAAALKDAAVHVIVAGEEELRNEPPSEEVPESV
jgi:DeoR family transcriptional regulator, fructose operon transcriptional repressor